MFTGIIQAVGQVSALVNKGEDLAVTVQVGTLDMSNVNLGDSIAVNGVCLTAVAKTATSFIADVSVETIERSTFKQLKVGSQVNLEKALTLSTPLGGHLVSGHVDGVGTVAQRLPQGRSEQFIISAPKALAKYIAEKGSVCVDGISLTVNGINGCEFTLNIVPHTLAHTIMEIYKPGHKVNLEVDIIARYLERLMLGDKAALSSGDTGGITPQFLRDHGFE